MPEYIHFRILWIWYFQKLQSTNLLRVSCFTEPTQRLTIYLATVRVWPTWNPKYYFCLHWSNVALWDHIYYSMKSSFRAFFLVLVRRNPILPGKMDTGSFHIQLVFTLSIILREDGEILGSLYFYFSHTIWMYISV